MLWLPGLAIAASLVATGWISYRALFADLSDVGRSSAAAYDERIATPSILIADRDGQPLYELIDPNGNKHVPLSLDAIPRACRQATVSTEDSRFYSHPGVDPIALVRAAWRNWRGQAPFSGASTITQQLARNLHLSDAERTERSLRRKLREAWLAWQLERRYSKDEILALYLNTTYYGHFAVGIEAAAQAYFGIRAADLDLAQCALLAGLPQYPAGYNPIEKPEAARDRQGIVLDLMVKDGAISQAQADDARRERFAYASTPFPIEAPHFVMWVQSELEQLLGPERLRAGGLRVATTLDLDWQRRAEEIVRRRLAQLQPCAAGAEALTCDPTASPSRRVDDAALVALDPRTGAVLAMVGSADYFDPRISGAVNVALSLRQPGSAIKPITYAAAFDPARAASCVGSDPSTAAHKGLGYGAPQDACSLPWTPATLIADLRTVFPTREGVPFVPQNYDLIYHGPVLARAALANSYNIPAVKALAAIGVDALIDQATRMAIAWRGATTASQVPGTWEVPGTSSEGSLARQLTASQGPAPSSYSVEGFGLALTLGGGEVRLLDLTAAYAAFANGGRHVLPYGISHVETLDGELLYVAPTEPLDQVVDPRVAYLITDILSDGNARLPAFGPSSVLEIGRPAAAKTGTTTDWRDNWTVGYTPDLVTGVWAGNADNTPMEHVSGIAGAGPIWHDFMVAALANTSASEFVRPDGLVRVEICADSGLLAEDGRSAVATSPLASGLLRTSSDAVPCPHRRFEWFIAGTEPTEVDEMHRQIAIDVRTGQPAADNTPEGALRWETIWVLPEQYRQWTADHGGIARPAAGQVAAIRSTASASRSQGVTALVLESPDPNRTYRVDTNLPIGSQKVPVTVRPDAELVESGTSITLLLDGESFAVVAGPDYTVWWQLARGRHTLQAVARTQDGVEVASEQLAVFVE